VIEPVSVMITHLTEMLRRHAHEIITRDDVKHLLENVKKKSPAVVEELIPGVLTIGEVQKVVKNLLRDRIPIKNLPLILETLADHAPQSKDVDRLTEAVRVAIGRAICERVAAAGGSIVGITLDPAVESRLGAILNNTSPEITASAGPYLRKTVDAMQTAITAAQRNGREPAILVKAPLRKFVRDVLAPAAPRTPVLSYNEVQSARSIESAGVVKVNDESA
jgi:flagellar biosynthesis protein FlhA